MSHTSECESKWRGQYMLPGECTCSPEYIIEQLGEALEKIHSWLVCAAVTTPEDMAQSFNEMEQLARRALEIARRGNIDGQ